MIRCILKKIRLDNEYYKLLLDSDWHQLNIRRPNNPDPRYQWEIRSTKRELLQVYTTVADLGGARPARAPPPRPRIFSISCIFCKIWQNHMLAPPGRVGAPSHGESWIRPCTTTNYYWYYYYYYYYCIYRLVYNRSNQN